MGNNTSTQCPKCEPNDCSKCQQKDCPKCEQKECPKCEQKDCPKCESNTKSQDAVYLSCFTDKFKEAVKSETNMSILGYFSSVNDIKQNESWARLSNNTKEKIDKECKDIAGMFTTASSTQPSKEKFIGYISNNSTYLLLLVILIVVFIKSKNKRFNF